MSTTRRNVLWGIAAIALVASGCSGGGEGRTASGPASGTTAGAGGSAGATSSAGSGAGGQGGESSTTSSGTTSSSTSGGGSGGGLAAEEHGPAATQLVNGGAVSKSAKHLMVWTLGHPTPNQDKATSAKHHLQGGLIGANGSMQ